MARIEKALKPLWIQLPGFSATYRYTKFGMASDSWTDLGRTRIYISKDGTKIGYLVTSLEDPFSLSDIFQLHRSGRNTLTEEKLDKFIIFISLPDPVGAAFMENEIKKNISLFHDCSYVLGYVANDTDEFTIYRTIPYNLFGG